MELGIFLLGGLGILIILSAILAVESKELMHAIFFLGVLLVVIGEIYILLGAEFVGVFQILVYAGGVTVLMLFTMLFIPKTKDRLEQPYMRRYAVIAGIILLLSLLLSIGYITGVTIGQIITPQQIYFRLRKYYFAGIFPIALIIFVGMVASSYIASARRG